MNISIIRSYDRDQLFWHLEPVNHDSFDRHHKEWLSLGPVTLWLAHRKTVIDSHDFDPVSAIEASVAIGYDRDNRSFPSIFKTITGNMMSEKDYLLRVYQIRMQVTSFIVYFKHPEDALLFTVAHT